MRGNSLCALHLHEMYVMDLTGYLNMGGSQNASQTTTCSCTLMRWAAWRKPAAVWQPPMTPCTALAGPSQAYQIWRPLSKPCCEIPLQPCLPRCAPQSFWILIEKQCV